jgi:hypothetical protein
MDAEEGTPGGAELEALATLVEAYERKKDPWCPPTPLEAIIFRMEQMGCTQAQGDPDECCRGNPQPKRTTPHKGRLSTGDLGSAHGDPDHHR